MKWNVFLTSNSIKMKFLRTIAQGIVGFLIANIDLIIGYITIDPTIKPLIVAGVMAMLSPIMAKLGDSEEIVSDITDEQRNILKEASEDWSDDNESE